jgi:hypothetical protein
MAPMAKTKQTARIPNNVIFLQTDTGVIIPDERVFDAELENTDATSVHSQSIQISKDERHYYLIRRKRTTMAGSFPNGET